MFQRLHFQSLTKRLEEPRGFMQVLVGPRQVGKTTLVSQLLTAPFPIFGYSTSARSMGANC